MQMGGGGLIDGILRYMYVVGRESGGRTRMTGHVHSAIVFTGNVYTTCTNCLFFRLKLRR